MEKHQLLYAVTVAKYLNFTKAAESLNISQPSLSSQIIKLENELNIHLFERSRQGITLTEAGAAFVFYAQALLDDWKELGLLMQDYSSMQVGNLRIGATPIMEIFDIPSLLAAFQKQHPKINITLLQTGSSALLLALKNKEIDIAFIISSDSNPEIIDEDFFVLKLTNDLLCTIMSPKNPLSSKSKISVCDLKDEKLILPTGTNTLQKIIKKYFDSNNIPFKTTYCCDQTEAALAFASENLGVYFGTANIAHFHGHYELECIPLDPPVYRSFSLVAANKLQYHPTLKNFVHFIEKKFSLSD
ncbi:MAG: LysR family transcriptional regulator [Acholeplasmataceae bacterium]|nr:LysR family transcriptional regulator [Acholeplasmataceae bacterium]